MTAVVPAPKRAMILPPVGITIPVRSIDTRTVRIVPAVSVLRVRASSPAPWLCAVIVEMPEPRFTMGSMTSVSIRYAVVMAVTVSVPKRFIKSCKISPPRELMLDCSIGGRPKRTPSRTTVPQKFSFR